MHIRSTIDKLVFLAYWPTIILAIVMGVAVPLAVLTPWPPPHIIKLSTFAVASPCLVLFTLVLADAETRQAVDNFNQQSRANSKTQSWLKRTFRRIGDPRLELCGWALCVEFGLVLFSLETMSCCSSPPDLS